MNPAEFERLTGRNVVDAIVDAVGMRGKATLTVLELAEFMRWGLTKTYEELRRGGIPAKKIGGTYTIFVPRLVLWMLEGDDAEHSKDMT